MCGNCYSAWWRRRKRRRIRQARRRACRFCGHKYDPYLLDHGLYCSRLCAVVACSLSRTGREGEEFHATRSRVLVEQLARAYVERGCRRVGRTASSTHGPYVAAWHRGEGLFLIRARLPECYGEEAA
jgi:hypothetical protein